MNNLHYVSKNSLFICFSVTALLLGFAKNADFSKLSSAIVKYFQLDQN